MVGRCRYESTFGYEWYGGAGIRVCERWDAGEGEKSGFSCFLEDMGIRPDGCSIDRIDPTGDYCASNCRWATRAEQARNQKKTKLYEYKGEKAILTDIAAKYGVPYELLRHRVVRAGWSLAGAIETPRCQGARFKVKP